MLYICYWASSSEPQIIFLHKRKRSQRKCKPEKCYKNEMKIEIKEKRGKNRGISCWNFCELWQKSEMTQSVCPTSVINPLWNQLEPFPTPIPFSVFCFPFSHSHCQRVKSIRAGCAPVQFDSCQSSTPAAFAGSPVALCPSLAPTGSTSSYDSVWGFALPAQAGSVCVACTGYECNTLWSTSKTPQHRDREAHRGTQEPSCEQDMDRTETETETTTMQMQMQSSQN